MNIIGIDGKPYEVPHAAYTAIINQGLAEIAKAEAVLDRAEISGIYSEFLNLPDALDQMVLYIAELEERLDSINKTSRYPEPGEPDF